jgi:uncharacterized small protein (DUF1192 family)
MQEDEDTPRARRLAPPPVLDGLGVAELRGYIEELTAEIRRAEAEIARKQAHRGAADSLFRPR